MKATLVLHEKRFLKHEDNGRLAVFEIKVWKVPLSQNYPDGIKYRAWLSENEVTIFGFDNHSPKGPHLHIRNSEVSYVYRGLDSLRKDIMAMIAKEGFIYEE